MSESKQPLSVEQRDLEGPDNRYLTNRETLSSENLKVGVHAAMMGGSGDLLAAIKIAEVLADQEGIELQLLTRDTQDVRPLVPSSVVSKIVSYHRGEDRSRREYSTPPMLDGRVLESDREISIFVNHSPDNEFIKPGSWVIQVGEFSAGLEVTDLTKKRIVVNTGINFDPEFPNNIQAGLFNSPSFERVLNETAASRLEVAGVVQEKLEGIFGKEMPSMDRGVGLYYPSTLKSSHLYFDLLKIASKNIEGPINIIAPFKGRVGSETDLAEFIQKIRDLGFNYSSQETEFNQASPVTVWTPGDLDHELFTQVMAISDLPILTTGDQSLCEGIQKSHVLPSPFFYYCYFGNKHRDLVDTVAAIDPEVSSLLEGYLDNEVTPNNKSSGIRSIVDSKSKEDVARLFYDEELQISFQTAIRQIPDQIRRAKEGHVKNPDVLVDVGETVRYILRAIKEDQLDLLEDILSNPVDL